MSKADTFVEKASFSLEEPVNLHSRAAPAEDKVVHLLAERSNWLRCAEGDFLALLEACSAHYQQFDANTAIQEESLLKRVKSTFAGERRRAHDHHLSLSAPLQKQLGIVRRQLSELDALTEKILTHCHEPSFDECKRMLVDKWPLPADPPPAAALREAWENACPTRGWRLTCGDDVAPQSSYDVAPRLSRNLHSAYDAWMPEWPSSERAIFKGGTSLPMPSANSDSSGPEELFDSDRNQGLQSIELPPSGFYKEQLSSGFSDAFDGSSTSETVNANSPGCENEESRSRRRITPAKSSQPRRCKLSGSNHSSKSIRSRDLSAEWVKRWLNSNELHELIEIDAELDAIRKLEKQYAVGRAKRRLGLHH